MTTLAPSEASNQSVGLSELERVERDQRKWFDSCCDDVETAAVARRIREWADTIAAYIAAQRGREWQPIETAPNDVSILVAYDDESIELVEAEDNNFKWSGRNPVTQSILGIVNPTHWMPLPQTPQANEKEKGDE